MTHLKLAALALMLATPLSIPPASAQQGVPGGHFIENWDLDRDGAVTPLEAQTKRDELFVMFDADGNGALDATEYDLFDQTRDADMATNAGGKGPGPMRPVIEGLVRGFNDTDGDGLGLARGIRRPDVRLVSDDGRRWRRPRHDGRFRSPARLSLRRRGPTLPPRRISY